MDALDQDVILLVLVIVVEQSSVEHDWVVLLGDLVGLRQIAVGPVLPIELNLRKDATTEGKRGLSCLVEAMFVQHGQHAW